MQQVQFSVPDMHCEGCASTIGKALEELSGIERVMIDLDARRVVVELEPTRTSSAAVRNRMERAGFPTTIVVEHEGTSRSAQPVRTGGGYALFVLVVGALALAGYVGYELYPRFDLPAPEGAGLLLLAAGAGIASFFSPCAFPLLVTLLARETAAGRGSIEMTSRITRGVSFATALSVGAALFLALAGLAIAAGGGALFAGVTFESAAGRTIRIAAGIALVTLGLVQLGLLPNPLHAVEAVARPLQRSQARYRSRGQAVLGFGVFGFGYLLAGFG